MEGLNNKYNMTDDVEQNNSDNIMDSLINVPVVGLELKDGDMEFEVEVSPTTMHEPPVNTRPVVVLATPAPIPPPAALTLDEAMEYEVRVNHGSDPNVDLKKLKRTLSNRLSARRSRNRKNNHVVEMEKKIDELQKLISSLTKEIKDYEENKKTLMEENASLQKSLDNRTEEAKIADGMTGNHKEEIRRLKGLASQKNVIEDCEGDMASCSKGQYDDEETDVDQYLNLEELLNGGDQTYDA